MVDFVLKRQTERCCHVSCDEGRSRKGYVLFYLFLLCIADLCKDDIIEFTKMMMDVANQVTADMSAISKQSPAVLKDFQAMRSGMESFQGSLNEGFEDVQQALADFWSRVRDEVNAVSEDVKKVGSNLDIVLMVCINLPYSNTDTDLLRTLNKPLRTSTTNVSCQRILSGL